MQKLLRSKLRVPPVWGDALPRAPLAGRLDAAIAAGRHVALVARSGYGKTMLLAAWARERHVAWIALEAEEANLEAFLAYLLAACAQAVPGFETEAQALLPRAREREAAMAAISVLLADLDEQVEVPWVLVLEDYHLAASPTLDALVARLLRHAPPALRVVLTSREELGADLQAVAASPALLVMGERELAFTREDLARLQPELAAPALEALLERTGGWPAAMGMAPDQWDRHLDHQVLAGLSPEARDLLLRAAVVDAVDAAFCEVALGTPLHEPSRERLTRSRLLEGLGEGQYTVPQPLRGMLRRRLAHELERTERTALWRRIGDTLWQGGQASNALRFWIEAGEVVWAAEALAQVAEGWLVEGKLEALMSALGALGPEAERPELRLVEGEVRRRWGDFARAAACLEGLAEEDGVRVLARLRLAVLAASRGEVAPARGWLAGAREAGALGDRAEMDARNVEGGIELLGGQAPQAIEHFQASLGLARRVGDVYAEARAVHNLGVCYTRQGDFRRALECYDAGMGLVSADGTPAIWMTPVNRALVRVYLGQAAAGREDARAALEMARRYRLAREEGYALRTLGFAHLRLGEHEEAAACFNAAELLARRQQDALAIAYSLNFQAELAASLGEGEAALQACAEVAMVLGADDGRLQLPEFLHVRAKACLAAGRSEEAHELVARLRAGIQTEAQRLLLAEVEGFHTAAPAAVAPKPEPEVVVRCFGRLRVLRQGIEVAEREWQSAKAKLLLVFLLHHPEGALKARLFEVLYPQETTTDASLNMNLMRLRKALEPGLERGQPSRYVLRQEGRYAFNLQTALEVDTLEFERLSKAARRAHGPERLEAWREALRCYGGDFLPEFDQDWVEGMRQRYRELALVACRELAAGARGEDEARQWVQQALVIDPLSEEFHRELILRYLEAQEPHRALEHYQLCERRFRELLDMPPPPDLGELVAHLRP